GTTAPAPAGGPPAGAGGGPAWARAGGPGRRTPPATAGMRPPAQEPARSTNRVNSAIPAALRVPCPTISNGGAPTGTVPRIGPVLSGPIRGAIGSWVIGRVPPGRAGR